MSATTSDPLEQVIRDAGENWLIDWFAPRDRAVSFLRDTLRKVDAARQKLGRSAPEVTAEGLVEEYRRNPQKVRTFLQVLGATQSPDILLMVWRVLHGAEILEIEMRYRPQEDEPRFLLRVRLESNEEYESVDIDDAVVLRHLGILKINGRPVFDGFFPLRLK